MATRQTRRRPTSILRMVCSAGRKTGRASRSQEGDANGGAALPYTEGTR